MIDLIIRGGRIVSGNGNPWFYGDAVIKNGKIIFVGASGDMLSRKVIDASHCIVCPGFIDAHSHSDLSILAFPGAEAKVLQGVTTEITGLDGFSLAPIDGESIPVWKKHLAGLNGSPDVEWNWRSFSDYLDRIDDARPSVNIASYAGLGVIRLMVMGMISRPASGLEVERMRSLAVQAMEEGARGVSAGLIYPPNQYQTIEEIAAVTESIRPYGGVCNIHLRSEGIRLFEAIDEAVEIGRKSGVHVIITHFKVMGRENWGAADKALEKIDSAKRDGVEVSLEQYPYTAASTMLHALVPPWHHSGGPENLIRAISDNRESVKRDIHNCRDWENWALSVGWENIYLASASVAKNQRYEGKSIAEIAAIRGEADPADAALDIIAEEEGAAAMIMFCMDEDDVTAIMGHPSVNFISDGILGGSKPHPRVYGSFARILGRYVRERKVLSLEDSIRKMTSLPAEKLRLKHKGIIAEGYDADIVVFDPETVIDTATYADPSRHPKGIEWVIVNGEPVVESGRHAGKTPGKAIRD